MVYWNVWDVGTKLMASIAILIPLHVVEEWVFPGGLHFLMNYSFSTGEPSKSQMNRLSDMITNLGVTLFYVGLTIYCVVKGECSNWLIIGTALFSLFEVAGHNAFGALMYKRFRNKGKTTIYAPGSVTAIWGVDLF